MTIIDHDLILGLQLWYGWIVGFLIWQDVREILSRRAERR